MNKTNIIGFNIQASLVKWKYDVGNKIELTTGEYEVIGRYVMSRYKPRIGQVSEKYYYLKCTDCGLIFYKREDHIKEHKRKNSKCSHIAWRYETDYCFFRKNCRIVLGGRAMYKHTEQNRVKIYLYKCLTCGKTGYVNEETLHHGYPVCKHSGLREWFSKMKYKFFRNIFKEKMILGDYSHVLNILVNRRKELKNEKKKDI